MAVKPNTHGKPEPKRSTPHGKSLMLTKLIVHFDCGFSNTLYIRGNGCASLSWEKGTPLFNIKEDQWVWETDETFDAIFFKILINDDIFEFGDDHQLICGDTMEFTPRFIP